MIKSSERRGDLATLIEHLYQKGWTLQRMGIIDETMNTYERAWKLREYCDDLRVPTKLANRIAQTRLLRNEYEVALQWADKAEDIARQIDCESDRKRELIHINYSRALIWASRGAFVQAESCLRPIVTESQAMDWQRGIVWTQRLLAEIRIAVGDLGEAEHLLDTHFPIIGRNKDKRGQALYERSFAMLERARGNYSKMHRWATQALDDFKRLGMLIEANEMRKLLEETTI
jgi:LuxR family glucitol operon transcriptional activator